MIEANLYLEYTEDELLEEQEWFLTHFGKKPTLISQHNKIIHYFQQDTFYKKEKELWKDPVIKEKIVQNRIKYLGKSFEDLTTYDILSGFKKSAIYYGYSGFNPLLCDYFYRHIICKYGDDINIHSLDDILCYDPCGGWGHRLLGSMNTYGYIYNDISTPVYNNINRMLDWLGLNEFTETGISYFKAYNNDAKTFMPSEQFNVMFTCPPYYNVEVYDDKPFKNIKEYNDLIDALFNTYINKESCKIFGMVIREDFLPPTYNNWIEQIPLVNNALQHLLKTKEHKYKEYLYIWIK